MDPEKALRGKRVLAVDDELDILEFLADLLEMCKVDKASTFEQAKNLLEKNAYHFAILDIMGVKGYELLEITTEKGIPTIMLTAHAISKEDLKESFKKGASFYVPKEQIGKIDIYLTDILEAKEKNKNIWLKWYERLSGFCDRRFGPNWKDEDPEFWNSILKY
jgi:DNA-binding NtrC family response regulator